MKKLNGYICLRVKGGIGNQLFEYAFAKSLSLDLNLKLVIDSQTGFLKDTYKRKGKLKYILNNFEEASITHKIFFFVTRKFPILSQKVFKSILIFESNQKKMLQINLSDLKKSRLIYLEGYFQSFKYFDHNWITIAKSINFNNYNFNTNIKNKVTEISENDSVCIHVRRIDYESKLDLEYYKLAINYYLLINSNCNFYIFSDDILWCKNNFSFLSKKYFISDSHSDEISELYVMSIFNKYIIANSSYSWWGAFLSSNKKAKTVIAPINISLGVESRFYPPSWILI